MRNNTENNVSILSRIHLRISNKVGITSFAILGRQRYKILKTALCYNYLSILIIGAYFSENYFDPFGWLVGFMACHLLGVI